MRSATIPFAFVLTLFGAANMGAQAAPKDSAGIRISDFVEATPKPLFDVAPTPSVLFAGYVVDGTSVNSMTALRRLPDGHLAIAVSFSRRPYPAGLKTRADSAKVEA